MQALSSSNPGAPGNTVLRLTRDALREHFESLLLFLAFFSLYAFTLAPDLLPADSGEFQAVVPLLGVAHPPGFSLYVLLGKLFVTLVRVGSNAYRLNLFSAFTSAITLVLVNLSVRRALNDPRQSTNSPMPTPVSPNLLARLPGLLAAVTLGVSTTFWSQATTANIRSLMALLTALAVYALVAYRLTPTLNRLALLAFSLSLAIVHHLSIAFIAIVFSVSAILFAPLLLKTVFLQGMHQQPGAGVKLLLAALAPVFILLYLPIRGAQGAYLAPPRLDTLSGFLEHALGLGFGGDFFFFASLPALPDRLSILINIFEFQFNAVVVVVLALGLLLFFGRDWKLALAFSLAFAVHCFVAITYRAPQTVEYLLPAYVILVVAAFAGLGNLGFSGRRAVRDISARRLSATILYSSLFIASLLVFIRNFPAYRTLSFDRSTRDRAAGLLLAAPPDAVLLASWHHATPLWYLQVVEGMRPDVDVEYVFPQGTSLAQNWVDRINESAPRRPTLVTDFYPQEYALLPYRFLPILTAQPAWEAAPKPLLDGPAVPTHEQGWTFVAGGASPLGLAENRVAQNESFAVHVFWQAPAAPTDINFFVQLIGPDGRLYGQGDAFHPAGRIVPQEVIADRFQITVNSDAPIADGYSLVTGAYLPGGARLAPEFTELARLSVVPRPTAPATRHPSPFGLLAGYDYDLSLPDSPRLYLHWRLDGEARQVNLASRELHAITLPAGRGFVTTSVDLQPGEWPLTLSPLQSPISNYQLLEPQPSDRYISFGPLTLLGAAIAREAGGSYRVDLDWMANEPITGDYIVKVDLVGENYAWRDQSDSVPAGGAIPTLKWIPGIVVHDRHRLKMLHATSAAFGLAVYDHFTQRNLPILDSRLALLGPTAPLGAVSP
jgi:hypothetical protein